MRILVTGGRDYTDRETVRATLAAFDDVPKPVLVTGGARGLDALADTEARRLGWAVDTYLANWRRYGKTAGPMRNAAMAEAGADILLAFPGGRGTAHMVRCAEGAGIPVRHVAPTDTMPPKRVLESTQGAEQGVTGTRVTPPHPNPPHNHQEPQ